MRSNQARQAPQADFAPPPQRRAPAALTPVHDQAPQTVMHPGVYKLALLCWLALLAVFWTTFWVSANALFMVAIGTFYALVFFGVPFAMLRIAAFPAPRLGLRRFLGGRFATLYGPVTGADALLQVVLVPLALAVGGIAIGIIIRLARP